MSFFFVVMKGEFDALLPWPFRQKVTLSVLNQHSSKHDISDTFLPDPSSSSYIRPTSEVNIPSGLRKFASLDALQFGTGFVKDDTMYVRIAVNTEGLLNY